MKPDKNLEQEFTASVNEEGDAIDAQSLAELLADGAPSEEYINRMFRRALLGSQWDILEILCENKKVNAKNINKLLAETAAIPGHVLLLKELCADKRVTTEGINEAFVEAAEWGTFENTKLLYKDKRITAEGVNRALIAAVRGDKSGFIELLCKDKRITNETIYKAISLAQRWNYMTIIQILDESLGEDYKDPVENLPKNDSIVAHQQSAPSVGETIQKGTLNDIKNLRDSEQISQDASFLKTLAYNPKFAESLSKDKNISADAINKAFVKYADQLKFLNSVYNFENLSEDTIKRAFDRPSYRNALRIVKFLYKDDRLSNELRGSYNYILNIKVKDREALASHIIQKGTLNDIKILRSSNIVTPSVIFVLAIHWGRLDAIKFIRDSDTLSADDIRKGFKAAAKWKHPDIIKFLAKDDRLDKDTVNEIFMEGIYNFAHWKSLHNREKLSNTEWQNYLKTLGLLYNDTRLDETLRKKYEYLMNGLSKKSESPDIEKTTQKIKNIQQNIQNKIMSFANQGK